MPFVVFRRRYSTEQLSLKSSNRRTDLLLIMVILIIEQPPAAAPTPSRTLPCGFRDRQLGGSAPDAGAAPATTMTWQLEPAAFGPRRGHAGAKAAA
ncbi:MAG: hypothetical protein J2P23_13890 [Microlunatus sp.]|nr:hypothetical protein [Microlunatus sp.]